MRPSRNLSEAIKDPGAAAARGRWLARGAWLLAAAEVVLAVRNHITGRLTDVRGLDRPPQFQRRDVISGHPVRVHEYLNHAWPTTHNVCT